MCTIKGAIHPIMIRVLFIFLTLSPANLSEQVLWWERDGFLNKDNSGTCSRVNFQEYLTIFSSFRWWTLDGANEFVGPQLPSFYDNYPRDSKEKHGQNDATVAPTYDTNGTNASSTATDNGTVLRSSQLEADLSRLLAQENQPTAQERAESDKANVSVSEQPMQHDAEPPLPSFNEWTKQKLEEQQQTKQQQLSDGHQKNGAGNAPSHSPAAAVGSPPGTGASEGMAATPANEHQEHARNYASKECGAKVLLANPQAQHASFVLNEKEPDEYMLNPCNVEQKFFILELCETIQISRLDLANFELFSSSPKDFRVFVSERYPSTEWTFLGAWTAEDQRKIQHFPVEQRLYAKYVKVELLSHYGSEHFCPLSLIRVLGVSVVEEYEAGADQEHRQQFQFPAEGSSGVGQAELGDKVEELQSPFDSLDATGSDDLFSDDVPIVTSGSHAHIHQELLNTAKDVVVNLAKGVMDKAQAVFSGTKMGGNATVRNVTSHSTTYVGRGDHIFISEHWRRCLTCDVSTNNSRKLCGYVRAFMVTRRPRPMVATDGELAQVVEEQTSVEEENPARTEELAGENVKQPVENTNKNGNPKGAATTAKSPVPPTAPQPSPAYATIPQDASSLPGVATSAKETVFARLNNRIRVLEKNISLSGEYLGELSLRYRKQMDDVQKAVNRSNSVIAEHKKSTEESLSKFRVEIDMLKAELEKMQNALRLNSGERNVAGGNLPEGKTAVDGDLPLWKVQSLTTVFLCVQLLVLVTVILYCRSQNRRISEYELEAAVERRVRHAIAELQLNYKKNGIAVHCVEANVGIPHQPSEIRRTDVQHTGSGQIAGSATTSQVRDVEPTVVLETKAKKRARKRQQQKVGPIRKSSDQTPNLPNRAAADLSSTGNAQGQQRLDCSPAGILFSSSNSSSMPWRQVPPKSRRAPLAHQHRRQGSCEALTATWFAQNSKPKLYSQNAFQVLASSASSLSECHGRSPEKRPRSGRGPS